MKIVNLFKKSRVNAIVCLSLGGFLLTFASASFALSCIPQRVIIPDQVQISPSQLTLAVTGVRMKIANSSLVVHGVVESISEDYARMNWSTAQLAAIRPIRTFIGESSAKFQVLVPIGTKLNDEVVIFANIENSSQVQTRVDWNQKKSTSTLKWTQDMTPLWVASEPCDTQTYSTKNYPAIVNVLKQILDAKPVADVFISVRAFSPGVSSQTALNKTIFLFEKVINFVNTNHQIHSNKTSQPLKNDDDNKGFFKTSINNISEGRYAALIPKLPSMNITCSLDYKNIDCASIELKPYAIHKLGIDYRPSAEINLNQFPEVTKYTPMEYEFISLNEQKEKSPKISYVHGIQGNPIFLSPGNYNIFAAVNSSTQSSQHRFQISHNGNNVFNFKEGVNKISVNTNEFTQPVETIVKWQLPSGVTKSVSTSFRLLTTTNGLDSYYQNAQSSCTNDTCTITAMRGQSIELSASIYGVDYRTEFSANKTIRIGDQTAVNLTFTPVTK